MSTYVIALPRTGSTTLTKAYSAEYGYSIYSEPWNIKSEYYNKLNLSNVTPDSKIVVKTMIEMVPKHSSRDILDFHLNNIPRFKRVILLNRYDISQQAVSLAIAKKTDTWTQKYKGIKITDEEELGSRYFLEWQNSYMELLARETKLRIYYYEDLFHKDNTVRNNNLGEIGINSDRARNLLNPNYKYRVEPTENRML